MDYLYYCSPVIAVCVLNLIYEICRKREPDAPQRGLPVVFLCAVLLPAAAVYACGHTTVWIYDRFSDMAFLPAAMGAIAGIVLLTVLILHLLSNKLYLKRKNRIIAAVLLLLAYLAAVTVLWKLIVQAI
ncbi:MAG: hypothetical protein IKH27_01075 [Oscillospiraceae bacterium]|nr:hypothetical protein [Oscillospiraceae bacterium]